MKIIILFFFLFLYKLAYSQNIITADSLNKYSYTFTGIDRTKHAHFGTCFFIQSQSSLFLITAKHIVYRCDSATNKVIRQADFLVLFISEASQFLRIEIPELYDPCMSPGKDTDLLVIKIDNKWMPYVSVVNDFLLPTFTSLGDLEMFGQGIGNDSAQISIEDNHHFYVGGGDYAQYLQTPPLSDDIHYTDSLHTFLQLKKISVGRELKGYSGSPIFLQDYRTKKWRLGGLLEIIIPDSIYLKGGLVALKPEYILNKISQFQ